MVYVKDRSANPEVSPSPKSRRSRSPRTPAFKPECPSRVVLKPAEEVAAAQDFERNVPTHASSTAQASPRSVVIPQECKNEKVETAESAPMHSEKPPETEEQDGSVTEISSDGSASPCSSADTSGESSSEDDDKPPYRPGFGFVPVCTHVFPNLAINNNIGHKWQNCHQWQIDGLSTWYKTARYRAIARNAPKADTTCVLGCCCRRCIGFPAAFRPATATILDAEDTKEDMAVKARASSDTDSSTSSESAAESSEDDVEVISPKPAPNRLWFAQSVPRWRRPSKATEEDRKVFVGNLSADEVTAVELREAFELRFRALPLYQEQYLQWDGTTSAVQKVAVRGRGNYAFVMFLDGQLASTAMLFYGMEFCGRKLRIDRPTDFVPAPDGAALPMDVGPLRRLGLLPQEDTKEKDFATASKSQNSLTSPPPPPPPLAAALPALFGSVSGSTAKASPPMPPSQIQSMKHIFLGNLPESENTLQDVTEMITCICGGLPAYDPNFGPAMLSAKEVHGGGWLIEMQSAALARQAQEHLRGAVFKDKSITVYVTFGHIPIPAHAHGGA